MKSRMKGSRTDRRNYPVQFEAFKAAMLFVSFLKGNFQTWEGSRKIQDGSLAPSPFLEEKPRLTPLAPTTTSTFDFPSFLSSLLFPFVNHLLNLSSRSPHQQYRRPALS